MKFVNTAGGPQMCEVFVIINADLGLAINFSLGIKRELKVSNVRLAIPNIAADLFLQ